MGDDLRAEPELHDLREVALRLGRGGGRGDLDVLDAERVERARDLELVLGAEAAFANCSPSRSVVSMSFQVVLAMGAQLAG